MPAVEFIIPPIHRSEEAVSQIQNKVIPLIHTTLKSTAGFQNVFLGSSATASFTPYVCIGWDSVQDFQNFVASPELAVFQGQVKEYLIGPPYLRIFDSEEDLISLLGHGNDEKGSLTEIFIFVATEEKKQEWSEFVDVLSKESAAVRTLNAQGLDTEGKKTVLGLVRWEGEESREQALAIPVVKQSHDKLLAIQGVENLLIKFIEQ